MTVEFHGSRLEEKDLLAALHRYCECHTDERSAITAVCPGHLALTSDQRFLDGLEFMRSLRVRLNLEEMTQ